MTSGAIITPFAAQFLNFPRYHPGHSLCREAIVSHDVVYEDFAGAGV